MKRQRTRYIVMTFVIVLAAGVYQLVKHTADGPSFAAEAPATTTQADVIVHATGLPPNDPVGGFGGAIPVFGVAMTDGTIDLDVPLEPGQMNDLRVTALIGGLVQSVPVDVTQASADTSNGVMTGRVATLDGQPLSGPPAVFMGGLAVPGTGRRG